MHRSGLRSYTHGKVLSLQPEFAERENFYTEYVHFGGSFGIRIHVFHAYSTVFHVFWAEYRLFRGHLEYVEYVFRL